MDLNKHLEFFNPLQTTTPVHVIGLGAIGSNLANQLVRLGFKFIQLYDFDEVAEHNITNQLYEQDDIGKSKITSLILKLTKINPEINITPHPEGWTPKSRLYGYVFTCVDSIELRKSILENNRFNADIEIIIDMRIGLEEAQMYSARWTNIQAQERILSTMNFKDSEVKIPVSACGTQLTVLPTIQTIVSLSVMNLIKYIKKGEYNYQTIINSYNGNAMSYKDKN